MCGATAHKAMSMADTIALPEVMGQVGTLPERTSVPGTPVGQRRPSGMADETFRLDDKGYRHSIARNMRNMVVPATEDYSGLPSGTWHR